MVKVKFELEIQEDGFPPISVESLNARLINGTTAELDNTPFFVERIALADVISCTRTNHEDVFRFNSVVTPSGNKSISIIFLDSDCREEVYQFFRNMGCYCEYGEFSGFDMLAVSIGKNKEYQQVLSFLDEKEELEAISYAELCL